MSASDSIGYFVELGEYNLIIARTTLGQKPRTVEAIQEVWLGDAAAADTALGEIRAGSTSAKAVALLRLKTRGTYLANAEQSKSVTSPDAVENFLRTQLGAENLPANWAWCGAKDGLAPQGGAPWTLDAAPAATTEDVIAKLRGWSFELVRCQSAPLTLAGAISSATQGASVLLAEVSEQNTSLISISKQGIVGLATVPVGFDALAGSTQTALGLKFRGSAARLMFNDSYDFAEASGSIVEPLANAIKGVLANLGSPAPTQLVCGGILARQSWISQSLAKALGLSPFTVDVSAWAGTRGLTIGGNITAANIAPSWLGVLSAASSYEISSPGGVRAWNPIFSGTPLAAAPVVPAIIVEPVKPATPPPVAKPAVIPAIIQAPAKQEAASPAAPAKPAIIPAIIQEPAKPATPAPAAKPATPPPQAKPAVIITPPSKPVEAPKPSSAPAKPASTPPTAPAKPAEVKPPVVAAKPTPAPAPAKPTTPSVAKPPGKPEPAKPTPVAKPSPAPVLSGAKPATAAPFPPKKNPMLVYIGIAAALIIGIVVFFVVSGNSKAKAEAEAREKIRVEAEAKLKAEARARAEAEQKAKLERETREKELQLAEQRLKNAEEDAKRQQEAARNSMLFGRGQLDVTTDPVGATITVGELAPKTSPVSMKDLRLGTYTVTISMAGYDTEKRDIEIKEKETTDLGTIVLKRQIGSIELSSEPSSLSYEVKPAGALFVNPNDVRTGLTPATLTGLPAGSYQVTITRSNWAPYVSTVTVERNGTAKVFGDFPGGTVVINSTPTGANILRDNQVSVGTTPLTLYGIPLGNVTYTVMQRGYDPITLNGKVEAGKTLTLNATLLDSERVMKLSELDERPTPISQADPDLSAAQRADGGKAIISLVVGRDGIPTDMKIEQSTNPAFGKACLAAAAKWRFKPGTIRGKPARSRVSIPFTITGE
ncbi:MAG: TonB family protein [Verrucomicrobia bacterium]|nr:TonB family protein [Verrucomicrobiota bacterium]